MMATLIVIAVIYLEWTTGKACTRAVYIGPDNMVITGRTMDWKRIFSLTCIFSRRGIKRAGYNKGNTVEWISKYGSIVATGYDIGTCDGMNEKDWLPACYSCRNLFMSVLMILVLLWVSAFGHSMCWIILLR